MRKVTASLVKPNMWVGTSSNGASTKVSYDVGYDLFSTNYKTNTGRFVAIGVVPLKTSRFTSRALIKVNDSIKGLSGTNSQTLLTVVPAMIFNGTKGATYKVALAIGSQDSGTTATVETYNHAILIIFDVGGGYCVTSVFSRLSAILCRSCEGVI